jgi:hypothetical protein
MEELLSEAEVDRVQPVIDPIRPNPAQQSPAAIQRPEIIRPIRIRNLSSRVSIPSGFANLG